MTGRLEGRVALITGASRGIGRAVAKRFAAEGAQLILVARTQGALEELDDEIRAEGGLQPSLVPMDLRDFDKIDQLGYATYERFGRLDVLVGNAGVLGGLTPVPHYTPETWQKVVDVNLTANFRLIRSFDPLLRQSEAGRGIFVSTGVTAGRAYWGAYAATKAGLEALVRSYAEEVANTTPVRVNLIDPGRTRTRMRAEAYPGEDPETLPPPESLGDLFLDLASPSCARNGDIIKAY